MHLEGFEWLSLLTWVSVLFVFLALLALLLLGGRTVRLAVSISYFKHRESPHPALRHILLTAASAIACAWMLQLSWGENLAMRLALMLVGGGVAWISLDWGSRQVAEWCAQRSDRNREWLGKAHEACGELRALFEAEALHRESCRLLRERLGAEHVYLLLEQSGTFTLGHFWPAAPATDVSLSVHSLLRRELASGAQFRALKLVEGPLYTPRRWSRGLPARLEAEQELLQALEANIAVPLQDGKALKGVFLIGPPTDGTVYEGHHLLFAEEVARQTSRSLDSVAHARKAFEAAAEKAQEQASRRMARHTRAHLAPPERFALPDLELSAQYWAGETPSRAFYDIVALPNRAAAFFLADIPDVLEEATVRLVQLQALLRARACAYEEDLAELVQSTQRALALSGANRPPIALFCARFVSGGRSLHYVNAGHFPPMLVRRSSSGAEILRLTTGGPAIGSTPTPEAPAAIEAGEVALREGDVLVLPSAAVVETPGANGEPWGEAGLLTALFDEPDAPARQLAERLLQAADVYAGRSAAAPPRLLMVLRASGVAPAGDSGETTLAVPAPISVAPEVVTDNEPSLEAPVTTVLASLETQEPDASEPGVSSESDQPAPLAEAERSGGEPPREVAAHSESDDVQPPEVVIPPTPVAASSGLLPPPEWLGLTEPEAVPVEALPETGIAMAAAAAAGCAEPPAEAVPTDEAAMPEVAPHTPADEILDDTPAPAEPVAHVDHKLPA